MEKYFVAPSYKHAKILAVNEETHKAHIQETCPRCGGSGIIVSRVENGKPIPIPVDGGICYQCGSKGTIDKWVKAYTEKEYNSYIASQTRAKEKREAVEAARKQALIQDSDKNLRELLEKFGYESNDPKVYVVYGGNTYAIKDELKNAGARFNPALGWYFTHPTEVPQSYALAAVPFSEVYEWFPQSKCIDLKPSAKQTIQSLISSLLPESTSDYMGEIKERLRDLKVTVTGVRTTEGFYGTSYIYTFKCGDNSLTWFSSAEKDIEEGESILLTGTVKKHEVYNGIKVTYLNRCIIKKED